MVKLINFLSQGSGKTARRERLRQADAARDNRRWLDAASHYAAVLAIDGANGPVHVQAGHMFKEAGQFERAEFHYRSAHALMPTDADLQLQLGHFYKLAGRIYEAMAAYTQAAVLSPGWKEPLLERRALEAMLGGVRENEPTEASLRPSEAPTLPLSRSEVLRSGLFDSAWYAKRYPDIGQTNTDPVQHFVTHGAAEDRQPGPGFDVTWYLDTYPDVADSGLDAFTHYVRLGRADGYKAVGPERYQRWIDAFDTLDGQERGEIQRHIEDVAPEALVVVVAVNDQAAATVGKALRSIRTQYMPAAEILVCVQPGCSAELLGTVRAIAGRDKAFQVLDGGRAASLQSLGAPVLLLDCAIELREHALYMFAVSCSDGTALAYSDEDRIDGEGNRTEPIFKPDASPELMRQSDYVGACVLLPSGDATALADALVAGRTSVAGIARDAFFGADRKAVQHIPFVLYHDHAAPRPQAKPVPRSMDDALLPTVTIIIPTRDRVELLAACVDSLWASTRYPAERIDVVVVDNGSEAQATADYLDARRLQGQLRVIDAPIAFNYARLNNMAVQSSHAELIVLLNNDTVIEDPEWLSRLAAHAMQPDVGAVGPKLLYEDGTIQHAGVVLNVGGIAAHAHLGLPHDAPGAMGLAQRTHEVAVVTGACLAVRRTVLEKVGGLDENLPVAFNDVLLCLACLEHGYRNIYVHDVWVRHAESKSRGLDDTKAKIEVFLAEMRYARSRFPRLFERDPYYSPNLSLATESIYTPAFPPRCRRPWRAHAALSRFRPKLLLLTSSLSEHDDIGPVVAMHARFLSSRGYEVVVGGPKIVDTADLGDARQVVLKRSDLAAVWAFRNDMDAVVVHTWPYMMVARLLGDTPRTILHDHGSAKLHLALNEGERWAARVDYALAADCFHVAVASSAAIAEQLGRPDAVICPPGCDRIGRWSNAVIVLREQTRRMRGWGDRIVLVAGGLSNVGDEGRRMVHRLGHLADRLSMERALVAVLTDSPATVSPLLVLSGEQLGAVAGVYAGADIYLDLSAPGVPSLGALEAASLGATVIRLDLSAPEAPQVDGGIGPGGRADAMPDTASDDLLQLSAAVESIAEVDTWSRRGTGAGWAETLARVEAALEAALGMSLGTGRVRHQSLLRALVSNSALIAQSGLFDETFYTAHYPSDSVVAADPLSHYMVHGWREGRRPSPLFHSDWYAKRLSAAGMEGLDPLSHYLLHPAGMDDPNPYFSNQAYAKTHPEAVLSGVAPLVHYLSRRAGTEPPYKGPDFDPDFYVAAYPEAAASGSDPLLHFLTEGDRNNWLPVRPDTEAWNAYADVGQERADDALIAWQAPTAAAVIDIWAAARFCIGLLCRSSALRARFPQALSGGAEGAFATWLTGPGAAEQGLSLKGAAFVAALFAKDISASLLQDYLISDRLRREHPFALTPAGLRRYVVHLGETAKASKTRVEEILWFAILRSERPGTELVRTWQFSPPLQTRFPLGITLFGRRAFATWLRDGLGLEGDWLDPDRWPDPLAWCDQIRLAWHAMPGWQEAHPAPFRDAKSASSLLEWLSRQDTVAADALERLAAEQGTGAQLAIRGLNLFGHFGYPSGLRTSAEALTEGYRRLGHSVATRDVWVQDREQDPVHAAHAAPEIHDVTLIHVQPEPYFDVAYSRAGVAPRRSRTYRIGYWYWELDTVPASWSKRARQLDEIWTATRFVAEALRREFDIPVHEVMPGLELPTFPPLPRSYFGLEEGKFLFLFTFHMTSIMERKNPLGLIRAFQLAFRNDRGVGLVLKTSFGSHHPELLADLHRAARGSDITIIDAVYTQAEVLGLMQSCDAYASLHRSEGYGLTMAEAMLLGKPVVATNYSGNLDFMSDETSLLVNYDLVVLDRAHGPYDAGTRWAEPSVEHAAELMRRIADDRVWAGAMGRRAQADLLDRMSYRRSGALMEARLAEINQRR